MRQFKGMSQMDDKQDEVGRLRDKDWYVPIIREWKFRWWRESDYRHRASGIDANMIHDLARALAEAAQTPPESAGELLSKSNNAALLPIDNKPQACEHKNTRELFAMGASQGFKCKDCNKWLGDELSNSPQDPNNESKDNK